MNKMIIVNDCGRRVEIADETAAHVEAVLALISKCCCCGLITTEGKLYDISAYNPHAQKRIMAQNILEEKPLRQGVKWNIQEYIQLAEGFNMDESLYDIAKALNRSPLSLCSQLEKMCKVTADEARLLKKLVKGSAPAQLRMLRRRVAA